MASTSTLPRLQTEGDDSSSAVLISPDEAAPATAVAGGSAAATGTGTRHRRTASDIKPTSPYARRMSLSSTPQSIRGRLPRDYAALRYARMALAAPGRRPLLSMAAVLTAITLSATAYSAALSLALNTSLYPTPPSPRTAYFAQKDNPFNIYGVKLAWLHTSLIYLTHLFTSPSPSRQTSRLWTYVLASTAWAVFTTWFFGRGIGDRIIELSGGKCVISLPGEWGLERERVEEMMRLIPSSVGAELLSSTLDSTTAAASERAGIPAQAIATGDNLYLSVPPALCTLHRPLTPKSHPDIFSIISSLPFSASFVGDNAKPLSIPRPRWYRGHDISGHIFILVLSTLLLTRQLVPTWRRWFGQAPGSSGQQRTPHPGQYAGVLQAVHVAATLAGTALIALWLWMTLMTATYFHNPQEKLSGLALGLGASFMLDILTPSSPTPASPAPPASSGATCPSQPIYPRSKPTSVGLDENRARRESIVDEGRLVQLQPSAEIRGTAGNGEGSKGPSSVEPNREKAE